MKQSEMSGYLKIVTLGVGVFLLAFVLWFLPLVLKDTLMETAFLPYCAWRGFGESVEVSGRTGLFRRKML